jgi:hypothetical protein
MSYITETSSGDRDLEALRKKLLFNGYVPLPSTGKRVLLPGWTTVAVDSIAIESWQQRPGETNTSIRTKHTPVIDNDVFDPVVADEIELAAWEVIGLDSGTLITRTGEAPRRAIICRTDAPFKKKVVAFRSPDDKEQKLEILGDGQQLVAFGIHPITRKPYTWSGSAPDDVPVAELPLLTEEMADQLIARAREIMRAQPGWTEKKPEEKSKESPWEEPAARPSYNNGWTTKPLSSRQAYAGQVLRNRCRGLAATSQGDRNRTLYRAAILVGKLLADGSLEYQTATRALFDAAVACGLDKDPECGVRGIRTTILSGIKWGQARPWDWDQNRSNFKQAAERVQTDPPGEEPEPQKIEIGELPPTTLLEWEHRKLPPADCLMGHWLTTTTRCLLTADTGLGKTNLAIALGMRASAGVDFLHWRGRRPCRVLYVDGEMSRELLQARLKYETDRLGAMPEGFRALSREDVTDMKPFNDRQGQAWLDAFIEKIGGTDLIIFDNIMCLTVGNPKDPESWQATLPYALTLTTRRIGQIWIHHTGHDASRSYGDKSREWQMDTTIHLDAVKRPDTDVSFKAKFPKARQRKPDTRDDFAEVMIALVDDEWTAQLTEIRTQTKISPMAQRFLEALLNVIGSEKAIELHRPKRKAATIKDWKAECSFQGLMDEGDRTSRSRAAFSKYKLELDAANRIRCQNDDYVWLI